MKAKRKIKKFYKTMDVLLSETEKFFTRGTSKPPRMARVKIGRIDKDCKYVEDAMIVGGTKVR